MIIIWLQKKENTKRKKKKSIWSGCVEHVQLKTSDDRCRYRTKIFGTLYSWHACKYVSCYDLLLPLLFSSFLFAKSIEKPSSSHSKLHSQTMPQFNHRSFPLRCLFSHLLKRCPLSTSASRLTEAGPLASRLSSRAVLRFSGADTAKYLQNLLTNDVLPLAQSPSSASVGSDQESYMPTPNLAFYRPPPVYAALLTPQGRFLYDLFLYRPPPLEGKLDRTGSGPMKEESNEEVTLLADVDADFLDEILSTFRR